MNKWFAGKFLKGNVQLAISEMEISFPKIFGHFNFQLIYPTDQILLGDKKISLNSLFTLHRASKCLSKALALMF